MIPKIAKRGTSFKGAGMYYLHDKREDGEEIRTTSERVAWTDTRNLASNDPEFAFKVMAATAMDKDRLKAQAGIKNTGRKSKGDVYAYSLAWHPDEQGKFDKAEMLQAADQSLKALGAQDHQAVIVAHQDEDHPHIHIILNMVNPENGKNLATSNDRKKVNKWSNDYRKARGEEHIYCPNKAKKYEAIEDKKRGMEVPFINGQDTPRHLHEAFKDARTATNSNDVEQAKARETQKDMALSQSGRQMHSRHSNQWAALSDNYQLRKKAIGKQYREEKHDAIDAVKAQMKPAFRELYKQQSLERKAFETREKRVSGKLKNMREAINFAKQARGEEPNAHFMAKIFNFFADAGKRAAWLNAKHDNQLKALGAEQSQQIKDAVRMVSDNKTRRTKAARADFKTDRSALISTQTRQKQDLQARWKQRNKQRKAAIEALKTKGRVAPKDEELLEEGEKITAKRQFKERAEGRKPKRTRSRTRKQE